MDFVVTTGAQETTEVVTTGAQSAFVSFIWGHQSPRILPTNGHPKDVSLRGQRSVLPEAIYSMLAPDCFAQTGVADNAAQ